MPLTKSPDDPVQEFYRTVSDEEDRVRRQDQTLDVTQDLDATLIMSSNKLRNSARLAPTVVIMLVEVATITGNTIFNEASVPNPFLGVAFQKNLFPNADTASSALYGSLYALQEGRRFALSLLFVPSLQSNKYSLMKSVTDQLEQAAGLKMYTSLLNGHLPAVATITGNVLWGISTVPYVYRLLPPPFDTWVLFNTQI